LGTSNGQPLSVGIGGGNGLRIFPSSQAGEPVLISGSAANFVTGIATGSEGATISGGGSPLTNCGASANLPCANAGAGRYSTIGGGFYNRTSGQSATVAGGSYGYASAFGATVGGGGSNTASAGGSTVAGGTTNEASGTHSAIGGGLNNKASESNATIAGGTNNFVSGLSSAVGGGSDNLADGSSSTIAGGATNSASGPSSAIGGGAVNRAIGSSSTIAGGVGNAVSGESSAIGGGSNNVVRGSGATIAGGGLNVINGQYGAIPGGLSNTALGAYSFAAGRNANAIEDQSFVWNGRTTAKSSGGVGTVQFASPSYIELDTRSSSTAGAFLTVHGALSGGVVAMGSDTKGVDIYGPGSLNFVTPTTRQTINLYGTDYGMGVQNNVLFSRSGGIFCWYIGGSYAAVNGGGCEPGAGGGLAFLASLGQFNVFAQKANFYHDVKIFGTLDTSSDRASKENIRSITPKSVLAKVAALPIALWNYKADDLKRTHMGPMAQDFRRAFNLGTDDKTIGVIDSAGVALAAIQGLNQVIKEKDAKIEALTARLKAIEKKLGM
jgi:trimeric autotransporter adhesin